MVFFIFSLSTQRVVSDSHEDISRLEIKGVIRDFDTLDILAPKEDWNVIDEVSLSLVRLSLLPNVLPRSILKIPQVVDDI